MAASPAERLPTEQAPGQAQEHPPAQRCAQPPEQPDPPDQWAFGPIPVDDDEILAGSSHAAAPTQQGAPAPDDAAPQGRPTAATAADTAADEKTTEERQPATRHCPADMPTQAKEAVLLTAFWAASQRFASRATKGMTETPYQQRPEGAVALGHRCETSPFHGRPLGGGARHPVERPDRPRRQHGSLGRHLGRCNCAQTCW